MIKDLQITMGAGLVAGEEWVVKYREYPGGTLASMLPNPTSNPIIIPALDDTLCYYYEVAKKCVTGYLGGTISGTIGDCGSAPGCDSYTITNTDVVSEEILYNECGTGNPISVTVYPGEPLTICAESGSVHAVGSATVGIVNNGACGVFYQYAVTSGDICSAVPNILYSAYPYGVGVTMYIEPGLLNPLVGQNFIKESTDAAIRAIDPVTGIVGALTGESC